MMSNFRIKFTVCGLVAAFMLFGGIAKTSASVISIDLDPLTAGIQSTLSVVTGSSFTIDVVYTGDGVATFDTFAFATDFNDLGAVLGLAGGTGSPTAGSIAVTAPVAALDAFSAAAVAHGSALTPSGVPFPITPGFAASSDGVGILSIVLPFGGGIPIGAGVTVDLFSLTLDALMPGMSTVVPSAGVIPPPLGGLALAGLPVPFTLASGSVTVTAIPLPAAFPLFAAALAGLAFAGYRRHAVKIV